MDFRSNSGIRATLRQHPKALAGAAVFVLAMIVTVAITTSLPATTKSFQINTELHPMVWNVLNSTPIIDGHNDLPHTLRDVLQGNLSAISLDQDLRIVAPFSTNPMSHTDIPRLKMGGVGGQFWSVYVSCKFQYKNAVHETLEQMDIVKRMISHYPKVFTLATSSQDIERAFSNGKIASLMGVEGGHSIGSSLAILRIFYELGVRYMTLTHNCNPPWASSQLVSGTLNDTGLSSFGKIVVAEMNRLGMLIDLSHVSVQTMLDALATTKAPVIYSHSDAYEVCNSSRNIPDKILKLLASNGGIIMVNFYPQFVSCQENATLSQVADHLDYIKSAAGEDSVGFGADYDGISKLPEGLEDVSKYPNLLNELVYRGWTQDQLEKLTGRNFLRVFRAAEKISSQLKQDGVLPSAARLPFQEIPNKSNCSLPWK